VPVEGLDEKGPGLSVLKELRPDDRRKGPHALPVESCFLSQRSEEEVRDLFVYPGPFKEKHKGIYTTERDNSYQKDSPCPDPEKGKKKKEEVTHKKGQIRRLIRTSGDQRNGIEIAPAGRGKEPKLG